LIPDRADPNVARLLAGMLKLDPADRFLIGDVLDSPAIRGSPELASDLPEVPIIRMEDGKTIRIKVEVCPEEFSFACKRTIAGGAGERTKSDGMIASIPRSFSGWGCDMLPRRSLET
jgi:hypothetical protein